MANVLLQNYLPKVNKRLDEWVTADRLDMKKLQFPKKEAKTPTKNGLPGSRPSSPEREVVSMCCTACCLQQICRYCSYTVNIYNSCCGHLRLQVSLQGVKLP